MDAICKSERTIEGETIRTYRGLIKHDETDVDVEAGTSGFNGGSQNKGTRAFFCISSFGGHYRFGPMVDEKGEPAGINITCSGDAELLTLLEALTFSLETLVEQCK